MEDNPYWFVLSLVSSVHLVLLLIVVIVIFCYKPLPKPMTESDLTSLEGGQDNDENGHSVRIEMTTLPLANDHQTVTAMASLPTYDRVTEMETPPPKYEDIKDLALVHR